jgi:hypothetical protein
MTIETTIRESLGYLRADDDWTRTALVGGLLVLFSPLVVPAVVVYGFYLRVLRGTIAGDDQPPAFDDLEGLLSDGVRAFAVMLGYAAIPIVVGVAFFLVAAVFGGRFGVLGGLIGLLVLLVGGVVTFVLGLALAYLLPAGLASLAERDAVGAAFDPATIRPVVTSTTYATNWLLGFAMVVAAGLVAWIPVLGQAAVFYAVASWLHLVGTVWADAHPVGLFDESEAPDEHAVV